MPLSVVSVRAYPAPWSRLAIACVALCGGAAWADPGYYVVTVYDDPGKKTVDFRYWTIERSGKPTLDWPEVGLAWNVNGKWTTEILASYIGGSDAATKLSSWNWQNDYLLTNGQYPFDLAVHTLLSVARDASEGRTFEIGPAFQTDIDRTQLNGNLFWERGFGALSSQPTQLKYQWQVRHRWRRGLHFGAQGFGELGPWDHWLPGSRQSHRYGPALFGSITAGPGTVAWQVAYLAGSVYGGQTSRMLTLRVKYDF